LPSVPSVYFQVLKELQSPHARIDKIGEIVGTDPGMTAKLLQLVNSAFFGISRRIASPAEAVQLLGIGTVRSLALSIHAFSSFEGSKAAAFSLQRVWNHSLQTGLGARKIAQLVNEDAQMADESFITGLLHDLGKMMLCSNSPDEYQRASDLARDQHIAIGEAEQQIFGATHADIGAYLLGLWGLPVSIVEGVALHHTPAKAALHTFSPLTAVHVANVLQHECATQSKGEVPSSLDADYLAGLQLQDYLPQWRAAIGRISRESSG
jgi:HD-like signal output (HDOD) protein